MSESGDLAWWSQEEKIANITMGCLQALVLAAAVVQLWRISRRTLSLNRQFTAKKVFCWLLVAVMSLRIAWMLFFVSVPCFTEKNGIEDWCTIVDYVWEALASMAFFFCYLATMLFWAEFVHVMKTRSEGDFWRIVVIPLVIVCGVAISACIVYIILAIFWARGNDDREWGLAKGTILFFSAMYVITGISLGWFGTQVTLHVHKHHQPLKTTAGIFCVALACSTLLIARSFVNIAQVVWGSSRGSNDWNALMLVGYDIVFEVLPSCLMLALMWPLPPLRSSADGKDTARAAAVSAVQPQQTTPLLAARSFN